MSKIGKINSTVTKTICIPKFTEGKIKGLQYKVEVPSGIGIVSGDPTVGLFDVGSGLWTIGTYDDNDPKPCIDLTFIIQSICPSSNEATITLYAADCDSNPDNDTMKIPLDFLSCCDINECVIEYTLTSTDQTILVTKAEDSETGDVTYDLKITGGVINTDTRIEFSQALPNGDWEFNIVDVVSGNPISTFTIPGNHFKTLKESQDSTYTGSELPTVTATMIDELAIVKFRNKTVVFRYDGTNWVEPMIIANLFNATQKYETLTTGRALTADDQILYIDNSGGAIALTVDPAALVSNGGTAIITIKVFGAQPGVGNEVTLTADSGVIVDDDTIGNSTNTYSFTSVGESIEISSNGTHLFVK